MNNKVYVGEKLLKVYMGAIQAILLKFTDVIILGRGKFTSKVIDISQIAVNKTFPNTEIKDIKVGTQELQNEDKTISVSTIEITIGPK